MNITKVVYTDSEKTGIMAVIDGQDTFIPKKETNRHYQAVLEWVAEGNTIEEAD